MGVQHLVAQLVGRSTCTQQQAPVKDDIVTFYLLLQELNVKLTKLGKQLQANQNSLDEIKTTLRQTGFAGSNAVQFRRRHGDGISAADGNTVAESDL